MKKTYTMILFYKLKELYNIDIWLNSSLSSHNHAGPEQWHYHWAAGPGRCQDLLSPPSSGPRSRSYRRRQHPPVCWWPDRGSQCLGELGQTARRTVSHSPHTYNNFCEKVTRCSNIKYQKDFQLRICCSMLWNNHQIRKQYKTPLDQWEVRPLLTCSRLSSWVWSPPLWPSASLTEGERWSSLLSVPLPQINFSQPPGWRRLIKCK